MFEKLFNKAAAVISHKAAPLALEREQYLVYRENQGYSKEYLRNVATVLVAVVHELKDYPDLKVGEAEVLEATDRAIKMRLEYSRHGGIDYFSESFSREAVRWLRVLGRFQENETEPMPFTDFLNEFATWMEREQGLSPATVEKRRLAIEPFLRSVAGRHSSFSSVSLADVDAYLGACRSKGLSRVTIRDRAHAIRRFMKFCGTRGWCSPSIAECVHGPRIYAQEKLPAGPSWDDVKRLIASMDTDKPSDIRDRAITMLLSIYGLRAAEVTNLHLEHIDWNHDQIAITRSKGRRSQLYPLVPVVGQAIVRYLKEVRPYCRHRQIFITLLAPLHPLSPDDLSSQVASRMKRLGIKSLPHYGPHALRHACAGHLQARGLTLKEIGDHLGHRSSSSTRIYAKVDLQGLREVAAYDLGGVI